MPPAGQGLAGEEQVSGPSEPLNAERVRAPSSFSVSCLGMNVDQPSLDDPKVRQALNLVAIAYDQKALGSLDSRVRSRLNPRILQLKPYSTKQAEQILQARAEEGL